MPNITWTSCTISWQCILPILAIPEIDASCHWACNPNRITKSRLLQQATKWRRKKSETTLQPQLSPPSISWQGAHWRWPLRMRRPVSSSTSTVQVQNSQLQFVRWNLFYAYLFITLCIFVEVTGCKRLLKEIKTILKNIQNTIWPPCAQLVWGQSTCRWSLQWQYSTVFAWQTEWGAPANSHGGAAEM